MRGCARLGACADLPGAQRADGQGGGGNLPGLGDAGVTRWAEQQQEKAAPAGGDDSDSDSDDDGMKIVLGGDDIANDAAWDPTAKAPATVAAGAAAAAGAGAAGAAVTPQGSAQRADYSYAPSANRYVRPELATSAPPSASQPPQQSQPQSGAGGGVPFAGFDSAAAQPQQQQQQQNRYAPRDEGGYGGRGGGYGDRGALPQRPRRGPVPAYVQYKNVFEVDIDALEDKPWRRLGADVSDYFNYNFSEDSWKRYTAKHRQVKLQKSLMHEIPADNNNRATGLHDPFFPQELVFPMRIRLPPPGSDFHHPHRLLEMARLKRARDPSDAIEVEVLTERQVRIKAGLPVEGETAEPDEAGKNAGEDDNAAEEGEIARTGEGVDAGEGAGTEAQGQEPATDADADAGAAGGGDGQDVAPGDDDAPQVTEAVPPGTDGAEDATAGAAADTDMADARAGGEAAAVEAEDGPGPADLDSMDRKELQALAKANGIKANLATTKLRDELKAKLATK